MLVSLIHVIEGEADAVAAVVQIEAAGHPVHVGERKRMSPSKERAEKPPAQTWQFTTRFRKGALGWRASSSAIERLNSALSEITAVARREPNLAAEGAIYLLGRISPAFVHIDTSSGALAAAVNRAIVKLVAIIAVAPIDDDQRAVWLDRLWAIFLADEIPYIEQLADHWGELCVSTTAASAWADKLLPDLAASFARPRSTNNCFRGTAACFSALLHAGRYREILALLDRAPFVWWSNRKWGFAALLAQGKRADALHYAEASRSDTGYYDTAISRACEEVLLQSGMIDEAYRRYGIAASGYESTYLARFRALAKRYPSIPADVLLKDLVASTPGNDGKWFAAAKSAKLFDAAIALANTRPTDPKTLSRAARDNVETEPAFALEAALAAVRWFGAGYGFDVFASDVTEAYDHGLRAAQRLNCTDAFIARVRTIVGEGDSFVCRSLRTRLGNHVLTYRALSDGP